MNLYLEVDPKRINELKNFNQSLGYQALQISTMLAPYDTGNLRRSIRLTKNTSKEIQITYDTLNANYLHFLEEGLGPVKKYKGFIAGSTVSSIFEMLVLWIQTGALPIGNMPVNILRSSTSVFNPEKSILRQVNQKTYVIGADQRQRISRIRATEYAYRQGLPIPTNVTGKSLESRVSDKTMKFNTKNVSELQKQYNLIRNNKLV